MDLLSAVFLGCFVFGFAGALVAFVSGAVHGGLGGHDAGWSGAHAPADGGIAAHGDLGGAHGGVSGDLGTAANGAGTSADSAGAATSHGGLSAWLQLNPTTVLTFLTWFGGAGFLLRNYAGVVAWLSLILAALAGLFAAVLVTLFLLRLVLPYQTVMREADYDPVGSLGRISQPVRAGGVGEVVFERGGTRRSLGARLADGRTLERGTEVVITRVERGLAYVEPWQEYVARDRRGAAGAQTE